MSFFDNVVGKLFGKQAPKAAFIHETLSRSERELAAYEKWKQTEGSRQLIEDIERGYFLKKQGIVSSVDVHILKSQYANGFAISYGDAFTEDTFKHSFDWFKERVLQMGYKLSVGDRKISEKNNYEETIEKWYLKPLTEDLETNLANQRYGNITVEKIEIDRKPNYIKFLASIYQDRLYSKALTFEELLENLFKQ